MSQVSTRFDGNNHAADRRVHTRQPVRSLAYVELGEGNGGIVLNVSEGGIAVQAVMSLMYDELPCVRVQLSHSKKKIEAKGRIAWTNGLRKIAGVEFVDLSAEARGLLREWVALEAPAAESTEEKAGSVVEAGTGEKTEVEAFQENQGAKAPLELNHAPIAFPTRAAAKLPELPVEIEPDAGAFPRHIAHQPPTAFRSTYATAAKAHPTGPTASDAAVRNFPSRVPFPDASPGLTPERSPDPSAVPAPDLATGIHTEPGNMSPSAASHSLLLPSEESKIPVATPRNSASLPPDRFGFKPTRPVTTLATPELSQRNWKMPALVALFAVVSLSAGWFAGHGALHGVFGKVATNASPASVSAGSIAGLPPPAANVSNIEVVDLNDQRWQVPMQGPLVPLRPFTPRSSESSASGDQQNNMDLGVELSAPVPSQTSAAAISEKAPPLVAANSGGPENVLPTAASGSSAATVSIPPPPPAFPSQTPSAQQHDEPRESTLQSGELIHRVEPIYPPAALTRRVDGTVSLYVVIDSNGAVRSIQPISGPDLLIPAAVAAVRQWRYGPSLLSGRPIQTERRVSIVFRILKP